ncbi:23S rRNA (adenine(2503)-C(2))-methyltransferase RlmN [Synergistaceae bacterium OttesenSCG-928-I11]|nr:23S rRNA (adenine(2503)-C(2))-methyltransferase RlmN [Synergistaceae bacterium OttesenSCG-928-I11]
MTQNEPNKTKEFALEKNRAEWGDLFERIGQPAYRAAQICAWLWKRGVWDPSEMTDFGKPLREQLAELVDFTYPQISKEDRSKDGTRKFLLTMRDGVQVEAALLKQEDRLTACISTQAGCPVGCPFCQTGASGFERNLTKGEIAGQLIVMERHIGRPINNLVLMGMGEPFLNLDAVFGAIQMLNDPKMRELGIRHITISTAGIVPGIQRMAESGLGARLAVSLHATNDELRDELVPCNTSHPLSELLDALRDYQERTGDRITIEYALFKGVNDTLVHARELVRILRGLHVYVNLIPGNKNIAGYETSSPESVLRFQSVLKSAGFESEIRTPRGLDIDAACGQLKSAALTESKGDVVQNARRDDKGQARGRETGDTGGRKADGVRPKHAGVGRQRTVPGDGRHTLPAERNRGPKPGGRDAGLPAGPSGERNPGERPRDRRGPRGRGKGDARRSG